MKKVKKKNTVKITNLPETLTNTESLLLQMGSFHFDSTINQLFRTRQKDRSFKPLFYAKFCFELSSVSMPILIKSYKSKVTKSCKYCNDKRYIIKFEDVTATMLTWMTTLTNKDEWVIIDSERDSFLREHVGEDLIGGKEGEPDLSAVKGKMPKFIRIVTSCTCIEKTIKEENPNYYNNRGRTEWYFLSVRSMTEEEISSEKKRIEDQKLMAESIAIASKDIKGFTSSTPLSVKLRNPWFCIKLRTACDERKIISGIASEDSDEGKQLKACAEAGVASDYAFSGDLETDLENSDFAKAYQESCQKLGIKPIIFELASDAGHEDEVGIKKEDKKT